MQQKSRSKSKGQLECKTCNEVNLNKEAKMLLRNSLKHLAKLNKSSSSRSLKWLFKN